MVKKRKNIVRQWFQSGAESTLLIDYPLAVESTVFDVGGYRGKWSTKIVELYNPYVFIFEPVPRFYDSIVEKFKENSKVSVFNFGLFDTTRIAQLSRAEDSSSIYGSTERLVEVSFVDIYEFLAEQDITQIDLIKINIEGAEYQLLRRMLDKNIVTKCQDIQVQFHDLFFGATQARDEIRNALHKTHFLTFDYPFVWENWQRRSLG